MISINYRDSKPIYLQIKENLRRLILTGTLPPGSKLPSVRSLAGTLAINPNTIQRAYRELEAEGYIFSIAGKGSFAADTAQLGGKERAAAVERFLADVQELYRLGFDRARIAALLEPQETPETEEEKE